MGVYVIYASYKLGKRKEKGKQGGVNLPPGPHSWPNVRPGGIGAGSLLAKDGPGRPGGGVLLAAGLVLLGCWCWTQPSRPGSGARVLVHSRSRSTAGAGGPSVCLGGLGPPSLFLPSVRGAPSAVRAPSPPADGSRPGCLAPRWRPAMAARGCALPSAIPCPSPC